MATTIRIERVQRSEDATGKAKFVADVVIRDKAGQITLYADGSMSAEPPWIIDLAASKRSDAKHLVR